VKASFEDLALLGGQPAFQKPLHVGGPNAVDFRAFSRRVRKAFKAAWFTNNGPLVQEFEARLAKLLGVEHCVAVCNATVGLEIVAKALGLSGEVILPSFTFVATAHALAWLGIEPVFCDIDPERHTLDPRHVESLITRRTSAILGVHVWGNPCPVDDLARIAAQARIHLIFDAAHALACTCQGRPIGCFGSAEVFSFHATKFVSAFEGGAITTNDGELARRLRLMRNFGFAGQDNVIELGTNGKMHEISAAMGLTGLDNLDTIVATNRENYLNYRHGLARIAGVQLVPFEDSEHRNYQYVIIEVDAMEAGLTRDTLVQVLQAENVLARRYFFPGCHQMEPYRSAGSSRSRLPVTERLVGRVLALPTGTGVSARDIADVCELIRLSVSHSGAVADCTRWQPRSLA
jgi:dTDP-4-amino-4,6-dideoxygalactose transaminase